MIHRSVTEAKAQLSSLIEAVLNGEEVIIDRAGIPVVRLMAMPKVVRTREAGGLSDEFWISPDFNSTDPELEDLFEGKID
jgi:prevent-host-death family protein